MFWGGFLKGLAVDCFSVCYSEDGDFFFVGGVDYSEGANSKTEVVLTLQLFTIIRVGVFG